MMMRPARWTFTMLICGLCAACAPRQPQNQVVYDPTLGLHVSKGGHVTPSVAGNIAGVTVGASPNGGFLGTRVGPIRLSTGF
ncbi:hypothetical protein HOY34_03430 [Xinfangfangia sp. D13-10-4-6]|uniref:hypothetical protein n=1 Tax=Pseudogemmobacter hezensis TaxID=2737662 RepID=UPI001552D0A3|nr:hypothetical protein [Pseudogemmobacter hezensis]NPD14250.1 hypothetical protein [Pseudogemmobacter hezensis]